MLPNATQHPAQEPVEQLHRWMLGVLIYEFMTGSAPFEAPYPMQIYAKLLRLGLCAKIFG